AREHSKEDRRSVTVELTTEGLALIESLIQEHVDVQHSLISGLSADEKSQVNQALKLLLPQFE
ncbi:MarR family transcriptional regulator, partial [Escherichia coli]|nr:MarR family transcriptional regulator [Escherichia coli]